MLDLKRLSKVFYSKGIGDVEISSDKVSWRVFRNIYVICYLVNSKGKDLIQFAVLVDGSEYRKQLKQMTVKRLNESDEEYLNIVEQELINFIR